MLVYAGIRSLRLQNRVKTAVFLQDRIYQNENAALPFVLGLLRPRIYLPFRMTQKDMIMRKPSAIGLKIAARSIIPCVWKTVSSMWIRSFITAMRL